MNNRLITVEGGFNIQSMFIGPFTLSKGECMAIDFPGALDFSIQDTLFRVLTGQQMEPAVTLGGKFVSVKPMISKPFTSLFMRTTAMQFLVANSAYDRALAEAYLNSNSIDPDIDINKLGYNDRLLLSLEVAYSKCKNIIISTSGLDYTGIQNIRNRVITEIENGAIIEITYPDTRGRTRLFDDTSIPQKVVTVVD